jgi:hypothetical protein
LIIGVKIEGAGDLLVVAAVEEDSQLGVVKGDPGMYQQDGGGHEMRLADQAREIGVTVMEAQGLSAAQRQSPAIFG